MRFSEDRIEKLTCNDGILRDIHIWEPENPRAVFLTVHGAMDYGGNYSPPGIYFKQKGIALAAYDQHGHDGKKIAHVPRFRVFLDDLDLMMSWVKEKYSGTPVFILSHSMGGIVTTLYGLERLTDDPLVKGFITSAPYFVNAVKVPIIMQKLVGVLSGIVPRMKAPVEDITDMLTRDGDINKRHRQDQQDCIKASGLTFRLGNEMLKAQKEIPGTISSWGHPILVIVAGGDKIADAEATRGILGQIKPEYYTEHFYPENFHENFNEPNREEVFGKILEWVEERI